ncbi:DNA alkylation repair protein [Lolliginicoccus levis]|uniref:DNA alkylation repair protein n=1 Tax=Lolliginicoccus levis TaxID=2919542 RepID=UPI00241FC48D|nr:DNA alkylation repair protein [Lolliginicoccus levis]
MTAPDVIASLEAHRSEAELATIRKRLAPAEPAIGLRMGDLFAIAKEHAGLPLGEVQQLLDHPAYEPRLAGFCILDFKARRKLDGPQREVLYRCYLDNHHRITTWDMVDRAAPRVIGGFLAGGSLEPLRQLAVSPEPLRRRTAITAPLFFVRSGSDEDLAGSLRIAAMLAQDPEPVVHNAVGIFLKHAMGRVPAGVRALLEEHAASMPRPGLRLAVEKLDPAEREHSLDAHRRPR